MAKKKKIMIVDPIDPVTASEEIKLVKPEVFKTKKINKYIKKEKTLLEKIKNFISKFTLK